MRAGPPDGTITAAAASPAPALASPPAPRQDDALAPPAVATPAPKPPRRAPAAGLASPFTAPANAPAPHPTPATPAGAAADADDAPLLGVDSADDHRFVPLLISATSWQVVMHDPNLAQQLGDAATPLPPAPPPPPGGGDNGGVAAVPAASGSGSATATQSQDDTATTATRSGASSNHAAFPPAAASPPPALPQPQLQQAVPPPPVHVARALQRFYSDAAGPVPAAAAAVDAPPHLLHGGGGAAYAPHGTAAEAHLAAAPQRLHHGFHAPPPHDRRVSPAPAPHHAAPAAAPRLTHASGRVETGSALPPRPFSASAPGVGGHHVSPVEQQQQQQHCRQPPRPFSTSTPGGFLAAGAAPACPLEQAVAHSLARSRSMVFGAPQQQAPPPQQALPAGADDAAFGAPPAGRIIAVWRHSDPGTSTPAAFYMPHHLPYPYPQHAQHEQQHHHGGDAGGLAPFHAVDAFPHHHHHPYGATTAPPVVPRVMAPAPPLAGVHTQVARLRTRAPAPPQHAQHAQHAQQHVEGAGMESPTHAQLMAILLGLPGTPPGGGGAPRMHLDHAWADRGAGDAATPTARLLSSVGFMAAPGGSPSAAVAGRISVGSFIVTPRAPAAQQHAQHGPAAGPMPAAGASAHAAMEF